MKKFLAILLAGCLILSMATIAFATPNICSQESFNTIFIQEADFYKSDSGAFVFTRTPSTSNPRAFSSEEFAKEQMVIQPLDDEAAIQIEEMIMELRAGGGSQEIYSDLSGAVVVYLTINYQTGTNNGRTTVRLTSISGKLTTNSSAAIAGQSLTYGQSGLTTGGSKSQKKTVSKGTSRNWTESIPSSWYPLYEDEGELNYMGANLTVDFLVGGSQGGEKVSLFLENQYY